MLEDGEVAERDLVYLRTTIAVAARARAQGNHPFGAVLVNAAGEQVLHAENTVLTEHDPTAHAEMNLVRRAGPALAGPILAGCTLYASTEPCSMCASAIYWAGVGRIVYGTSAAQLNAAVSSNADHDTLDLSCRTVFAAGTKTVEVCGPLLEAEAWRVHEGFWT